MAKNMTVVSTADRKLALLLAIAALPEEAFGWLVLGCVAGPKQPSLARIWPDGLGGFSSDSREGIAVVQKAARALLS